MADTILNMLPLVSTVFSLGLAVFVFTRNPKHLANISFSSGMAALAVVGFSHFMGIRAEPGAVSLFWTDIARGGETILPVPWLIFSLVFGRSNPSDYLRKWRVGIFGVFLISLVYLIWPAVSGIVSIALPYERAASWFPAFLLIVLTIILANFEWTVRSADHTQRWRIKFLILGIGSIFAFKIYTLSQELLYPSVERDFSVISPVITIIGCCLIVFSLVRHRLMDVDVYVSRDVAYNSFTIGIVALYLVIVGLGAMVIRGFSDTSGFNLSILFVYVCLLLLLITLLSTHVRKKVRFFINQHFYRGKYDYRKEWLRVTDKLSSKLQIEDLYDTVSDIFSATFWIDDIVLWIYDDVEGELRSVTWPGRVGNSYLSLEPSQVEKLKSLDSPIAVEKTTDIPEEPVLDQFQREIFQTAGLVVICPLVFEDRFVGLLGLSRSRAGYTLDREDLDLIKTISKQTASSLLNATLIQNLIQSKKAEAFHSFSAFVVHDLKNFVAMLSLVVKNMERRFDDPRFRKDALESISKTVEKMKRLMDNLAVFSGEEHIALSLVDLNDLARSSLSGMAGTMNSVIFEDFVDLPPVRVDPDLIGKVITNLLMNAEEATGGKGKIKIGTSVRNGMVSLSVSDDGCGMTKDFIENGLFELFSTTKSNGFGIGLYQAKKIVAAHRGKIEVESEPGRGSNITVTLPAAEE